ncbi:hypothetical protein FHY35_004009 [Xanthomonas arboricola]|uniref:hypothetical protein n=1 Tax=Xanthomonas arboricola TaxID=56448 RepID=UPI00141BC0D1|nr:hypothetical protein [Xanthomonas arboricola]NIJ86959.1 hypothetical protein [Xanthomonas arboricola]
MKSFLISIQYRDRPSATGERRCSTDMAQPAEWFATRSAHDDDLARLRAGCEIDD